MARISGVRTTVDTASLKRELQSIAEATRKTVADLAKQSLEAQISAIRDATTNRRQELDDLGISVSRGTVNDPLQGAKVIIEEDADSLTAKVEHTGETGVNVFNLLDAGIRARTMRKKAIFPAYEGNTTPDRYDPDVGDPALVASVIVRSPKLLRDPRGGPALVAIPAGRTVGSVAAREFYKATAEWVEKQLLDKKIVTPTRRSRVRIRKGDVKITYTSDD